MNWNLLLLNCQPQKFKYYLWEFTDIHLWMLYTVFIYCASHSLPLPHPLWRGMTYEKGGLRQFADLKGGGVFEGVDTPMHTMLYNYYLNIDISKEQKFSFVKI